MIRHPISPTTPCSSRGERGQTTVEFAMTFGLVVFLVVAVVQLSLICSTKLLTNYSAWIAARVWAVNEDDTADKATDAAETVLHALNWGWGPWRVTVNIQDENEGVEVLYRTPLGIPFILTDDQAHRVTTLGWGAVPKSPLRDVDEVGDNQEPQ